MRRFHEGKLSSAPTVTVWGTGKPRREFLCSDDLADACIFLLKHYSDIEFVNVGTGEDVTIAEFAEEVAHVVGFRGKIIFDTSRPDGAPQKLLNVSKIKSLGWSPSISLRDGLTRAYTDFLAGGGLRTASSPRSFF
jgi:GDP-L-fucose synthase